MVDYHECELCRTGADGERDPNLATAVEWSGRPELEQAVIYLLNETMRRRAQLGEISMSDKENKIQ